MLLMSLTVQIIVVGLAGALLVTIAIYIYGSLFTKKAGERSSAYAVSSDGPLDQFVLNSLSGRAQASGLRLSSDNQHAFAIRALSARKAVRSLDLQYYYWKDDLVGTLMAGEVLAAADRGVRVRLLLDDINLRGKDSKYLSLDAHRNIEVRVFNPSWNRLGALQRGFEMLIRAYSSTRRMHNKAWIADGRIAIVGGRNIGNAYFDAARQFNFHDMDVAAIGPAAQMAEKVFDQFWNSDCALPLVSLPNPETGDLDWLRQVCAGASTTQKAVQLNQSLETQNIEDLILDRMHLTENIEVLSDPPAKKDGKSRSQWLYKAIIPIILSARESVEIISPYFIPGQKGVQQLLGLTRGGVNVRVLTNSLAATDVAAVHGAYSRYRRRLIRGGVELYELKPEHDRQKMSVFGSRGASLHTKAFVVDGRIGFVGSFNFDARSHSLNTEMGIIFENAELAEEIITEFRHQTSEAFLLKFHQNQLAWIDQSAGSAAVMRGEPGATIGRRFIAMMTRLLPIESQL